MARAGLKSTAAQRPQKLEQSFHRPYERNTLHSLSRHLGTLRDTPPPPLSPRRRGHSPPSSRPSRRGRVGFSPPSFLSPAKALATQYQKRAHHQNAPPNHQRPRFSPRRPHKRQWSGQSQSQPPSRHPFPKRSQSPQSQICKPALKIQRRHLAQEKTQMEHPNKSQRPNNTPRLLRQ